MDLFGVNTVMCGVYIRKCCMMLPGLKLTSACVVYTFGWSGGYTYNTCRLLLLLLWLVTNKLFLSGLKLTGTWAVHTFAELLNSNTVSVVYIFVNVT